ncbi:hypothetical protein [uncultured Castellaniella sp.]|uniref:lysozyme inhibitor LprI family protein n=1 Tax=uncultured Castellaniella sp. TaxID=647907 RepID=UPI002603833A|nr:hypothetical protein [uncultured Castellaniella sp.]
MFTSSQKKNASLFVATIGATAAVIALWPAFASLYKKSDSQIAPPRTAVAPGGIAIAGGTINALPTNSDASMQITINNGTPISLDFFKQEIIGHEQQKQVAKTLEAKLEDTKRSLGQWQFWYFRSAHPRAVEMLQDLAALRQNYLVQSSSFNDRWAKTIPDPETRTTYINDVLLRYGWAQEQDGVLHTTKKGLDLLKQSGLDITPYAVEHVISPSFDCRKADKWYEKEICSNAELARLDVEMVRLFKQLKNKFGPNEKIISASQVNWRNKTRNVCLDQSCLVASYNERIRQLRSEGAQ